MNFEIRSLLGRGVYEKERVTLRCLNNADLGQYLLLRSESEDGLITTGVKNTLWFPDKSIKKGDLVVVYTKIGVQSEKMLSTGSKAHFFYLGASMPIWKNDEDGAVLLHAPKWQFKLAGSFEKE